MKYNNDHLESRTKIIDILSTMVKLLNQDDHGFQAGELREMIEQISSGKPLTILDTNALWGGPGSVVDCAFLHGSPPSQESIANEAQFGELIISLVSLLEKDGFATNLMLSRRNSYQYWKDKRDAI